MRRYGCLLIGVAALGACGGGDRGREVAVSDSLTRELEIAPEDTTPAAPLPDATSRAREQRSQAGGRAGSASKHPVRGARGTTAPHAARPAPAHGSLGDSGGVRAAAERRVGRGTDTAQAHSTTVAGTTPIDATPTDATPTDATPTDTGSGRTAPADAAPAAVAQADPEPTDSSRRSQTDTLSADGSRTDPSPPAATTSPEPPSSAVTSAPSPPSRSAGAAAHALPIGTEIRAMLEDSIHSLRNSEGQRVTALVSGDLRAPDGKVLVPSGSTVWLTIARLRPARTRSAADGELELHADSIAISSGTFAVNADIRPVPHELQGRGVTAGEVVKVAAWTAVGAAAGAVITGKTKGAVIGGAVGAAGGAVVAAQTASRDVVVAPKTLVVLVLTAPWQGGQP